MNTDRYILAKYDVSGIQSYIFATNRLRENVGASHNVGRIMKRFLIDALIEAAGPDGKNKVRTEWEDSTHLEIRNNQELQAEVIYIGGGNAEILFREYGLYDEASRRLAMMIEEQCRGITVFTAFAEVDLENYLRDSVDLDEKLAEQKRKVVRDVLLSPYPIVEQDASYGLPVTCQYPYKMGSSSDISTVQYEKFMAFEDGEEYKEWNYAVEMEDLIKKRGEDSYVAVVHIDGNGMGEFIHSKIKAVRTYEEAVCERRRLSRRISQIMEEARQDMEKLVNDTAKGDILPFRCLICDGDDFTFICSAQLGIPAVTAYIRRQLELADSSLPISSCGGIAFVHSHFPFRIAYEIAEECCSNAKKSWYKEKQLNQQAGYLDFYVVRGAYVKGMKEQRQENEMRMRPLRVAREEDFSSLHSIDRFHQVQSRMSNDGEEVETWPRSRLKRLYEAGLQGREAVMRLDREYSSRGYEISQLAGSESYDGIFDSLEVMDFYNQEIDQVFRGKLKTGGIS